MECEICKKNIDELNEEIYLVDGYNMCDDCKWMSDFGIEKTENK